MLQILRWSERYTKVDMVYLASGHFWFMVGRGVALASGFMLTVGFANLLSPTQYGVYKYLLAGAGLIGTFTLGGMHAGVQRALARGYSNVIRPMVRYASLWNAPSVFIALSVGGYYLWNDNVELGIGFLFIAVSMAFTALGITKSLFFPTGEFRLATYFGVLRTVLPVFLILVTLLLTKNVLYIVFVYLASQIGMNALTYYLSLRQMQPKTGKEFLPETKRYSLYMSALNIVQVPAQYLDQFLLWHFLGPVALATYTIAQGPAKELRTLADNAANVIFPKLARKDPREHIHTNTVPKRTVQLFLVLCGIVGIYILAAPLLFKMFFPAYIEAVFYSQLIAAGILLQPRSIADMFLFAHSGLKDRYTITIPSSLIRIALFALLIPMFGILGAIAATIIAELINSGIVFYLYWRFERKTKVVPPNA